MVSFVKTPFILIALLSLIGHLIGAYCFYYYAVEMQAGGDSLYYFNGNPYFSFVPSIALAGLYFIFKVSAFLRELFFHHNILGFFLFSGVVSFFGSLFYFLTFNRLSHKNSTMAACILMLWPSYFFFSAGIIKDSTVFVGIALLFFVVAREKVDAKACCLIAIASVIFLLRPYLLMIFLVSFAVYFLLEKRYKLFIPFLLLMTLALFPLFHYLNEYAATPFDYAQVGTFAVNQQMRLSHGTFIPMLTHDPYLVFLTLPYLFFMQLFLPLGWYASNGFSYAASIENGALFLMSLWFLLNLNYFFKLVREKPIFKFYLIYFLVGMSTFSMLSTNLGLAMREKMMFVPALLSCILGTYACKRKD